MKTSKKNISLKVHGVCIMFSEPRDIKQRHTYSTGSCKFQLKYAKEDIWRAVAQAPGGRWGGAEIIFGEGQSVLVKSRMPFYVC